VYGVDLPLCLHAGESDWQHVSNLYDAVLLKSTRIGHGFNLSFFPAAEGLVQQQNTCIEVSPLSNQILGYVRDLRIHPAHAWIKRGIQISISPDDPGVFGYIGVTPDYWSIFLAWELDLRALKKLAMNSIMYSHLDEAGKKEALALWEKKWDVFVNDVIMND
jgi:adenosine deaminase CECR1